MKHPQLTVVIRLHLQLRPCQHSSQTGRNALPAAMNINMAVKGNALLQPSGFLLRFLTLIEYEYPQFTLDQDFILTWSKLHAA